PGREADAGPFEHDQPYAALARDVVRLRCHLAPAAGRAVEPEHDPAARIAVLREPDPAPGRDSVLPLEARFRHDDRVPFARSANAWPRHIVVAMSRRRPAKEPFSRRSP